MSIHILEAKAFFDASVPIGDSQRLVLLPSPRPVAPGDEVYLRDEQGNMTWTADVLLVHETAGLSAWDGRKQDDRQMYVVLGWLARIHPGTLTPTKARLQASWVTLNSRTLQTALPWRTDRILIYHHTMRLVEIALTPKEVEKAQAVGCIAWHRSGHWIVPMGEARKRLLVEVLGQPLVCSLCGGPIPSLEDATQDHRLPSSQGGPDVLANVQLAHKTCNEVKGNALPEQYPPLFVPPTHAAEAPSFRRGRGRQRGRGGRGGRGVNTSAPVIIPRPHVPSELPTILPPALAAQLAATVRNGAAGNGAAAASNGGSAAVLSSSPAGTPVTAVPATAPPAAGGAKVEAAPAPARRRGRPRKADRAVVAEPVAPAAAGPALPDPDLKAGATAKSAPAPARKRGRPRKADRAATAEASAPATTAPAPAAAAAVTAPPSRTAEPAEETPAAVSAEWLDEVQAASWSRVVAMSAAADWAANTATLRTMGPLRRNQAAKALAEATALAEQSGPEGRFALLQWGDRTVLVEERGEERHCFQVRMLRSITPEVYVWHLSHFGRRTPLGVAMALLSLWRAGTADGEGRVLARKGDATLVLGISDDRFVECRWQDSGTAVA